MNIRQAEKILNQCDDVTYRGITEHRAVRMILKRMVRSFKRFNCVPPVAIINMRAEVLT